MRFWGLGFVVVLIGAFMVACGDRYRNPCDDPNKALVPPCARVIEVPLPACPPLTKNKALNWASTSSFAPTRTSTEC